MTTLNVTAELFQNAKKFLETSVNELCPSAVFFHVINSFVVNDLQLITLGSAYFVLIFIQCESILTKQMLCFLLSPQKVFLYRKYNCLIALLGSKQMRCSSCYVKLLYGLCL